MASCQLWCDGVIQTGKTEYKLGRVQRLVKQGASTKIEYRKPVSLKDKKIMVHINLYQNQEGKYIYKPGSSAVFPIEIVIKPVCLVPIAGTCSVLDLAQGDKVKVEEFLSQKLRRPSRQGNAQSRPQTADDDVRRVVVVQPSKNNSGQRCSTHTRKCVIFET